MKSLKFNLLKFTKQMQAKPSTPNLSDSSNYKIYFVLIVILALCLLKSSFIGVSYWLDECISIWVSSEGVFTSIARSWNFQGQAPLYYVILAFWIKLFGSHEIAARALSLLFLSATVAVLFGWLKKVFSTEAALLGCITLVCQDSFQLALSARPYALAILATICAAKSFDQFIRDERSKKSLAIFCLASTIAIYAHYFSALSIISIALLALFNKQNRKNKFIPLTLASLTILILCAPLYPQLALLQSKSLEISFAPRVNFTQILESFFPLFSTLGALIAATTCATFARIPIQNMFSKSSLGTALPSLLILWWTIPSFFLLALSLYSNSSFLLPRYLCFATPAFAGLTAIGFALITKKYQPILAAVFVCLLSVREFNRVWVVEDWKSAIELASTHKGNLLLASGLAESNHLSWLESKSEETKNYLLSPLKVYASHSIATVIPNNLTSNELKDYLRSQINENKKIGLPSLIIYHNANNFVTELESLVEPLGLTMQVIKPGLVGAAQIETK